MKMSSNSTKKSWGNILVFVKQRVTTLSTLLPDNSKYF